MGKGNLFCHSWILTLELGIIGKLLYQLPPILLRKRTAFCHFHSVPLTAIWKPLKIEVILVYCSTNYLQILPRKGTAFCHFYYVPLTPVWEPIKLYIIGWLFYQLPPILPRKGRDFLPFSLCAIDSCLGTTQSWDHWLIALPTTSNSVQKRDSFWQFSLRAIDSYLGTHKV